MNKIMQFELENKENFYISTKNNLNGIDCCCEGGIIFKSKKASFIIGKVTVLDATERLKFLLKECLENKMLLHSSLIENVGLINNEYNNFLWEKDSKVTRTFIKEDKHWIGYNYKVWSGEHKTTWLYNDKYGNIILEITPWFNSSYQKHYEKMPFMKWIKSYKPILKRIISKEIAEKWVIQADLLIKIIEQNIEKMKNEHTYE